MFQGMFAIITPALISGAVAERIRFWPVLPVHAPVGDVRLLPAGPLGVGDRLVRHELAGRQRSGQNAIGLARARWAHSTSPAARSSTSRPASRAWRRSSCLRKRHGYPKHAMHPNSMVLTLLGAGLLWFGWFGFNGGSALGSTGLAVVGVRRHAGGRRRRRPELDAGRVVAPGQADRPGPGVRHRGRPGRGHARLAGSSTCGAAWSSGWPRPSSATSRSCLKSVLKYDDSLDAFGVHGVGGFLGAVLTGVFCSTRGQPGRGRRAVRVLRTPRPAGGAQEKDDGKLKSIAEEGGRKETAGRSSRRRRRN